MLKQWLTLDITCSNWHQFCSPVDKVKSHFIPSATNYIAVLYSLRRFESATERLQLIESLLADNMYHFPVAKRMEGGACGPKPMPRKLKAGNGQPVSTFLTGRCHSAVYINKMLLSHKEPQKV
jgi:hypothetical protein